MEPRFWRCLDDPQLMVLTFWRFNVSYQIIWGGVGAPMSQTPQTILKKLVCLRKYMAQIIFEPSF